jgi:hypothetical protein
VLRRSSGTEVERRSEGGRIIRSRGLSSAGPGVSGRPELPASTVRQIGSFSVNLGFTSGNAAGLLAKVDAY